MLLYMFIERLFLSISGAKIQYKNLYAAIALINCFTWTYKKSL